VLLGRVRLKRGLKEV
jgi:hypothetical protein